MRTPATLALLSLSLLAASAHASNSTQVYSHIIGTGEFSCGDFVDAWRKKNQPQLDLYAEWAWGFLVAYNDRGAFDSKVIRDVPMVILPDEPTELLSIRNYCYKHPTSIVANAVTNLLKSLGGRVVWHPSKY